MNVPANLKYLYFNEAADFASPNNAACYHISAIKGFRNIDATSLQIEFAPMLSVADSNDASFVGDSVDLTITSGKHKEVIAAILNEIAFGRSTQVVIADTANSLFLSEYISAVAVTVTAEA
jgi:hypothetical protein